jgi:ADP-heptose:LPS heptosyltransferase
VRSVSFDKLNIQKWLMVQGKWNLLPDLHIVERYLASVQPLGIRYDGRGLDFFIPASEVLDVGVLADRYFPHQERERAALANQRYVALVVGAAHATKRMLPEQLAQVAAQIKAPVLLLGGPDDREVGVAIAEQAGEHVVNTCGQYSLAGSASLVQQAAVVVSHDTGLMHIAAAFNRPIISIWGNTIPEFGMYPFYESGREKAVQVQVSGLSCRPCSKIGYDQCPRGHFKCMKGQSVPAIVARVHEKLLKGGE